MADFAVAAPQAGGATPDLSSRRQRMAAPLVTAGVVTVATLALHVRDPHAGGSWGYCPSALLGIWCPGCGGLRAVNDLGNGDLLGAASSNLAFVVALPFLLLGFAIWSSDRWRGVTRRFAPVLVSRLSVALLALLTVFTVLRNLPAGSWLAP